MSESGQLAGDGKRPTKSIMLVTSGPEGSFKEVGLIWQTIRDTLFLCSFEVLLLISSLILSPPLCLVHKNSKWINSEQRENFSASRDTTNGCLKSLKHISVSITHKHTHTLTAFENTQALSEWWVIYVQVACLWVAEWKTWWWLRFSFKQKQSQAGSWCEQWSLRLKHDNWDHDS